MNRFVVTVVVLAALALGGAPPAGAEIVDKAKNTGINAALGVVECPKAWWDEASREGLRGIAGAVATGPLMCGANVLVRYLGVVGDLLTLPWGDNLVQPNALEKQPPLRLP